MIESLYNMQAMKALKKFTHFIIDFFCTLSKIDYDERSLMLGPLLVFLYTMSKKKGVR